MAENRITKSDLNKVFARVHILNITNNYERMQAIGFLTSFIPVLKRLYKDADQETRARAMHRHLEFFNSHVNSDALILGVAAAVEENTAEDEKEAVSAIKTGLMGPLAGIGDSLLKFTWLPICGSIGAALALEGNFLGVVLMFLMYNVVNVATKYYGIHLGYSKGAEFLEKNEQSGIMQRVAGMANVVGLMVIGSMIVSSVKLKMAAVISVGEQTIEVQEMIDKIMPNFLPLLFTFAIFFLLKKLNGKHTPLVILGVMVASILLVAVGVL